MAKPNPTIETWRVCVGFADYEVSSLGVVRRTVPARARFPHVMAGWIDAKGYRRVKLTSADGARTIPVHRLVAFAFLGDPPPLHEVNHRDGIKSNNAAMNLEWVTGDENKAHAARLGLTASGDRNWRRMHPECVARGEQVNTAKLTARDVHKLRELHASGIGYRRLGRLFGITRASAGNVCRRKSWAHIE